MNKKNISDVEMQLKLTPSDSSMEPKQSPKILKDKKEQIKVLCFNLSGFSPEMQIMFISMGVFAFFMSCSYVEEFIFLTVPGFEFGWYLTLIELSCFSFFALTERYIKGTEGLFAHNAALSRHLIVAVAMTCSRGLTNVSMQYLNYPTQVIFKSMKLITVMIGSVIILRKSYLTIDYIAACLLVSSAIFFSLGDVDVTPEYDTFGIIVVVLSLFFDAIHSNTQEQVLKEYDATLSETMLFSNFFSACCTFVVLVAKGEMMPAIAFCGEQPHVYGLLVFRASVIYGGVLCFTTLIKHYGVVLATTVTTVRKILTIIVSFLAFPHAYSVNYLYGFIVFVAGLALTQQAKRNKINSKN